MLGFFTMPRDECAIFSYGKQTAKKCNAAWLPMNIGKLLLHFTGAPSPERIDALGMVVLNLLLPVLQAGLQP